MSRLALGTVQFGLAYGITNAAGQVPEPEVRRLLAVAQQSGITTLDTAALYGESEAVLGRTLPGFPPFRIVTKTSKAAGNADDAEAVARLEASFAASLSKLRIGAVYGLIAHEADDLLGPHGEALYAAMTCLKEAGKVTKIGASVYTGAQIDALMQRFALDLVQVPFNALDKRLSEGGQLARLAKAGVEVHCRSIFLQGLLLQAPDAIPAKFGPLSVAVRQLHETFAHYGLSPLEGLIACVLGTPQIGRLVAGVTAKRELEELVAAEQRANAVLAAKPDFMAAIAEIRIDDPAILSPALWGQLAEPKDFKKDLPDGTA